MSSTRPRSVLRDPRRPLRYTMRGPSLLVLIAVMVGGSLLGAAPGAMILRAPGHTELTLNPGTVASDGARALADRGSSSLYASILVETSVALGSVATAQALVVGGTPPFEYQWRFNANSTTYGANASFAARPLSDGYFDLNLSVRDADTNLSNATATLLAYGPSPVSVSVRETPGPGSGQITFVASASGGTPPLEYLWTGPGNDSPSWSSSPSWTIAVPPPGTYEVRSFVRDAYGYQSSTPTNLVVNGSSDAGAVPLELTLLLLGVLGGAGVGLFLYFRRRYPRQRKD